MMKLNAGKLKLSLARKGIGNTLKSIEYESEEEEMSFLTDIAELFLKYKLDPEMVGYLLSLNIQQPPTNNR